MDDFGQTCRELQYKFLKIVRNKQSSFRIKFAGRVIYIDPIKISEENHDADYIFITHEHFDHLDSDSILKILKPDSVIITNSIVSDFIAEHIIAINNRVVELRPLDHLDLDKWISVDTIPAYNVNKFREDEIVYHPKENEGLGFVLTISIENEKAKVYHMGDTDFLPEYQKIEDLDILMIPVGGTYVMTWQEAVKANNEISPIVSIPMHFDLAAGSIEDAQSFIANIENIGEII